ncbi:MAG: hydroxyacid dehydrogenase [Candidatus Altiarchaeia archaeon]
MKVAFYEIKGWEEEFLKKELPGHELSFHSEPLTRENVKEAADAEALSIFIYSKIDRDLLSLLPKARLIVTRSTGFDHIDLAACKESRIAVCNVPAYGENTVAEHTFALILSLSRNVHKAYMRSLVHDHSIEGLKGFDLKGRTLGVVGAGKIGLHVIRIAKAFGMNVLAFDTKPDTFLSEVLGFDYASMDELLSHSDIITLHVPYNKYTHHLINRDSLVKTKKGALLINTSRGAIVDTAALIEALDKGILSGAGLDVIEGEDLIKEEKQLLYDPKKVEALGEIVKEHILLGKDNVVYTPHIAFYSQEALERILEETAANIAAYAAGSLKNSVY